MQVMSGGVKAVAAGRYHSLVVTQDGGTWATGWNKYGQLGDGSLNDKINFVKVVSGGALASASVISFGYFPSGGSGVQRPPGPQIGLALAPHGNGIAAYCNASKLWPFLNLSTPPAAPRPADHASWP